jgi:two-component system, cell cycle sensor histidine kinase and response regulator CckA
VQDEHADFDREVLGSDTRILDHIDDAVTIGDAERRFLYWNPAAERMFGYSFDEVRGRRFEDIVDFEVVAPGGAGAGIVTTATGGTWRGDAVLRTKDGRVRRIETTASPILVDGELVGRISINRDVTEMRRLADTLSAVLAASPLGIAVFDQERRIQFWSDAAAELFGWTAEEVIGTVAKMVPQDELADGQHIWDAMLTGHIGPYDVRRLTKAGTPIDVRLWGAPLFDVPSASIGVIILIEDMRERHRLETTLLQAQKLESVGRLAGGIAHDFNNLLTAIGGYAEILSSDLGPTDERQATVRGIRQATDQATALTRQLLAFSRSQELRPAVVDLRTIVTSVQPLLRRLLGERVTVELRLPDELWPTLADRNQIESVLVNLGINARDAMPNGGTITIETANVELDSTYARAHADVVPGEYAMVAVSDTGTGMDPETLSQIFEPFFTTKEAGKGTGLGLATVYGTIRQSGGYIWVYSEPGQGTSFKIYFPRAIGRVVAPAAAPPEPPSPAAPSRARILLVEDEQVVRDMVRLALERRGYRVMSVGSAERALDVLLHTNEDIDLLLSDVVMPGMDGPTLLEHVWQKRPGLLAIFMSGYTAGAMERRPIPDGMTLLEKPFTAAKLDETIRQVLGGPTVRLEP